MFLVENTSPANFLTHFPRLYSDFHKEDGGKYVKFRVKDDFSILAQNGFVLGKNFSQIWVEIKKIITIGGNRPRLRHAPFIPLHADIKNYP